MARLVLPPAIGLTTGVFNLDNWPTPFPAALYGVHELVLKLWTPSATGQPLPLAYQTNPPDNRLFENISTANGWMWIDPGCRNGGGIVSVIVNSFKVNPTNIELQATGTVIATTQQIKVSWDVTDTNPLAPTKFGYRGSCPFVQIFLPGSNNFSAPLPLHGDNQVFNIGGVPYTQPCLVSLATGPCTSVAKGVQTQIPLYGTVTGNQQPPPLVAADIAATTNNYLTPPYPVADESFKVNFACMNIGGKPTGAFKAAFLWGDQSLIGEIDMPSIEPGAASTATWPFDDGLSAGLGYEIYCVFDPENTVAESNKNNNTALLGFDIDDDPQQ
ncbi:MAG: CARDB domain-containing protein [Terriglobales bacterium]